MTQAALDVRDLHVDLRLRRSTVEAVRGVSLAADGGRLVALVGPSGSGKTMVARAVAGALPRSAELRGRIEVDGIDLRSDRPPGLVAMAFQEAAAAFNPTRTIEWHLRESCRVAGVDQARAIPEALEAVGLDLTHGSAYSFELSGGQVQRAGLALAIVTSPGLLFADEVTTALDRETENEVLDRLGALARSRSMTVVFVTHDLALVERWADEIAVMDNGRIVEHGPCARILSNPAESETRSLLDSRIPEVTLDELRVTDATDVTDGTDRSAATDHHRDDDDPATTSDEGPVLEVRGVAKRFEGQRGRSIAALDGVDLVVGAGERIAVVGRSGSGKTTLLRLLAAVERPDTGSVRWNGTEVSRLDQRSLRAERWRVQMVFQSPLAAFDPRHSVTDIVAGPIRAFPDRCPVGVAERVEELLGAVGLDPGLARRRPDQLSGGQRQRVAIARALSVEPEVLLCDEPVSSLDANLRRSVVELIARLCAERGMALVFVTHDLAPIPLLCERGVIMDDGRIVERFQVASSPSEPVDVSAAL
ncbi:MAG: ATP-binding cassette domain-containing protein [Actinomycetota bacterium]